MTYGKTLWMFFDENPREKNNILHEQQGKLEDSVIYTYIYIYIIYSYIDSQAFFLEENSQIECFECFRVQVIFPKHNWHWFQWDVWSHDKRLKATGSGSDGGSEALKQHIRFSRT